MEGFLSRDTQGHTVHFKHLKAEENQDEERVWEAVGYRRKRVWTWGTFPAHLVS